MDPKPLGEVLPVAADRDKEERTTYLLGFAVDVRLPTRENYAQDFAFNRIRMRMLLERGQAMFANSEGKDYVHKLADIKIEKLADPGKK